MVIILNKVINKRMNLLGRTWENAEGAESVLRRKGQTRDGRRQDQRRPRTIAGKAFFWRHKNVYDVTRVFMMLNEFFTSDIVLDSATWGSQIRKKPFGWWLCGKLIGNSDFTIMQNVNSLGKSAKKIIIMDRSL